MKISLAILNLFLLLSIFQIICCNRNFKLRNLPDDSQNSETIETPTNPTYQELQDIEDESYFLTPIKVGNPPQNLVVSLDTASDYTWIPNVSCSLCNYNTNKFDPQKSKTFSTKNTTITIRTDAGSAEGVEATENINLSLYKAIGLDVILVNNVDKGYKDYSSGVISLSYKAAGDRKTFLDVLKDNKQIGIKMISLQFEKDAGTFFIGEYPTTMERLDIRDLKTCNITERILSSEYTNKWVCDLTGGFIGDDFENYFEIKDGFAYIDSGSNVISAPSTYKAMFKEKYLLSVCEELTWKNGNQYFECEKSAIDLDKFEPLYLVLGQHAYKVLVSSLFKLNFDGKKYRFTVIFTKDSEVWGLGKAFMKHFTTILNQENKTVGFHGGKSFNFAEKKEKYEKKLNKVDNEENTDKNLSDKEKKMKLIWQVSAGILMFVALIIILLVIYRCIRRSRSDDDKPLLK